MLNLRGFGCLTRELARQAVNSYDLNLFEKNGKIYKERRTSPQSHRNGIVMQMITLRPESGS